MGKTESKVLTEYRLDIFWKIIRPRIFRDFKGTETVTCSVKQMFITFRKVHRRHLCWSLFLIELQSRAVCVVNFRISLNFSQQLLLRTLRNYLLLNREQTKPLIRNTASKIILTFLYHSLHCPQTKRVEINGINNYLFIIPPK